MPPHKDDAGALVGAWLEPVLAETPAVSRALIHAPATRDDPYRDDGRPPALALQLCFAGVAGLDAAPRHLQIPALADALRSLRGSAATQQAMLAGAFPVPEPRQSPTMCSYLVLYEDAAKDLDPWVVHDTTHHTASMAHFPGMREIEICTRRDWGGALPWPHANHMLRDKVVFDAPPAPSAALNSPTRHEMRANYATFPKFTGLERTSRCTPRS